ncbi:MAG TPA: DMT family transporter [Myxococcaceae bacterium]
MEGAPRGRTVAYAAVTVQAIISSLTYLVARRALVEIPPVPLLALRFAVAGSIFLAMLAAGGRASIPPRALWPRLVLMGFLVGPINQGFFFVGLDHSTPAHAALLYALTPTGVYLLSLWRGRESLRRGAVIGLVAALAGVVVLLLGRGLRAAASPLWGDLLILVAVVAWVIFTDQGKQLIPTYGPNRMTAWSMVAGALWVLPLVPFNVSAGMLAHLSTATWLCLGYLGVITSVISYLLWYFALSRLEASKVAVFSNLQPVFTALAALALLQEPIHWELVAGGTLVLLGVRLTQRS